VRRQPFITSVAIWIHDPARYMTAQVTTAVTLRRVVPKLTYWPQKAKPSTRPTPIEASRLELRVEA
jgi:hypothetical protein